VVSMYMNAAGGRAKVQADPVGFARLQWDSWSPPGWYEETEFIRTAESFGNPDWAAITLRGYRSRSLPEPFDRRYGGIEKSIAATSRLCVPTLMIQGEADECDPPSESENDARWFDGSYERIVLPGAGHFSAREATGQAADAIVSFCDRAGAR
jgi:pimeloyl-ACP methyl ester carboxylesterase